MRDEHYSGCSHGVCGGVVWFIFCNIVLSVPSRFAKVSLRKKELVALL